MARCSVGNFKKSTELGGNYGYLFFLTCRIALEANTKIPGRSLLSKSHTAADLPSSIDLEISERKQLKNVPIVKTVLLQYIIYYNKFGLFIL